MFTKSYIKIVDQLLRQRLIIIFCQLWLISRVYRPYFPVVWSFLVFFLDYSVVYLQRKLIDKSIKKNLDKKERKITMFNNRINNLISERRNADDSKNEADSDLIVNFLENHKLNIKITKNKYSKRKHKLYKLRDKSRKIFSSLGKCLG